MIASELSRARNLMEQGEGVGGGLERKWELVGAKARKRQAADLDFVTGKRL